MIVRIQQFPVQEAERLGGWPEHGPAGPLHHGWPEQVRAFEIIVRDTDERGRPVSASLRRDHLKSVIPTLVEALKQPQDAIVARLDGPLAEGELLGVFTHLIDLEGYGRFALSPVQKLDPGPAVCMASVRIEMPFERLMALCADPGVNLDRSVRLRVFAVPEELVNPLLDTSDLDDERWRDILPRAGFLLQPVGGMDAIQVITTRFSPEDFSDRVTRGLAGG